MADDQLIKIERNSRPWQPASGLEPPEVLQRYDIPLAGLLQQGDSSYLFRCLSGEMDDISIWSYTSVSTDEARQLRESTSPEELRTMMEYLIVDRPSAVCVAASGFGPNEGLGIVVVDAVLSWENEIELQDVGRRVNKAFQEHLRSYGESSVSLREVVLIRVRGGSGTRRQPQLG